MNVLKDILNENLIIETERLRIYPFKINSKTMVDLYAIYSKSSNVENYCNVYNEFKEFFIYMNSKIENFQNNDNGIVSFVIELKENSKIIGIRNVILDGVYTIDGNKEINNENLITEILIKEDYWQKGIAFEASIGIFKLLKIKGIKNVLSFINHKNIKANYLDNKLGFKFINFHQAQNHFNYHKDFGIHGFKIEQTHILLKTL
jgi:RimJ/RimL family protein N-acetyltransferase